MTIQEYIRIAVNGFPKAELEYYRPYFYNIDCEHCIYNGYACKEPKGSEACIDYRVEKSLSLTHENEKEISGKVVSLQPYRGIMP